MDYSEGYSGILCQLEKKVKVRVVFLSATRGPQQIQWPLRKFAHPRQKQLSSLEICFFKSLPIVAVFASPSNSAAHDKAHSQVLMLHLSMHFNPLPVLKGAGAFHSAGQSKEGSVGFGTSQHPIFMKLLPDHLWH